ncbi:MAG: ABC transporter permease, partial [Clostridiaceae bacterium]|nr:ABC transporter permease [Clostridiaceae bacterium]
MSKYILKRLGISLIILIGVSALIYLLVMLMPSDYIDNQTAAAVQSGQMTYEDVQRLKELYGLADKSFSGIVKSYVSWLGSAMKGDLGFSFLYGRPVTQVINDYVWISFLISLIAYVIEIIIAIPMGIKAAVNQYSGYDYTVSVFSMIATALPSFFLAALLMNVFSIRLGWMPLQGLTTATQIFDPADWWGIFKDKAWHLVLPILTLTLLNIGGL